MSGLGGNRRVLIPLLALQVLCILFLLAESILDLFSIELEQILGTKSVLEVVVVAVLICGAIYTAMELRRLSARNAKVEDQLRAASGAFADLLDDHFSDWGLTPAERDVALMAIKGLSIAEIAGVRGAAEGTVKAQCNRIYKKAGVTGRQQLLALFVEEMLADPLLERPDA